MLVPVPISTNSAVPESDCETDREQASFFSEAVWESLDKELSFNTTQHTATAEETNHSKL